MAQDAEAAASADDTASADGTAARSSVESWLQPGDALEDWTQEPFEEPDLVAETEPEREPEPEPVRSPAAQTPSRRPRASSLHDWIAAPLPSAASSLDDRVQDRKSTRLNSSHVATSYAVFCLKKKNTRAGA